MPPISLGKCNFKAAEETSPRYGQQMGKGFVSHGFVSYNLRKVKPLQPIRRLSALYNLHLTDLMDFTYLTFLCQLSINQAAQCEY